MPPHTPHRILAGWLGVLDSGEARQPVLVDVNAQRVARRHQDVDAHVKLVAINEKRLCGERGRSADSFVINTVSIQ